MTVEDCYHLGYIVKPHGLKGEVQVLLDVDYPDEYKTLESVFVQQGQQLVPFFITAISLNGDKAIVRFEDTDSLDLAQSLKGCALYLPLSTLPEREEGDFYFHELVGLKLIDVNTDDAVGMIENVFEAGPQTLLSVKHKTSKEVLIPLTDELIKEIDKENNQIHMFVPEGLVDVYLED
ncbi:ribosome maturation factor RimM [Roseivirga seohaensis subsp. aquiponti]|uniref:Ribosome maturation factor RimM n=1 Tax=Roseivirga seohaensis subsp. aquiponti TaxID=1566026 RepID=A0A0L8AJH5_9BACT|nr:ribosome maturation factor RimM [Roseivirga seohaensis]KOF02392.1 ribosome maturation factor RimM [Roseivirga seohaensis subsp. aquiponti]